MDTLDSQDNIVTFTAVAKVVQINSQKEKEQIALASLANLKALFKDDDIAEKVKNDPDLLFIASNLILCDYANLNDDCIMKEDVIEMADSFEYKQINTEHNRNEIRGVICDIGYSLYPTNIPIKKEVAKAINDAVQLVIGGYLWRAVDRELCDFVESASIEGSPDYEKASTSFELKFDHYDIAIGNGQDRNARNARIISAESSDWEKYNKLLRRNEGPGKDENDNIVFRVFRPKILGIGAGIVARPASGLKGIVTVTDPKELQEEGEKNGVVNPPFKGAEYLTEYLDEAQLKYIKQAENIKTKENSVSSNITSEFINMVTEIKSFDDLAVKWADLQKLEATASITNIRKFIEGEIEKSASELNSKLNEKENLIKEVQANREAAEKTLSELTETLNQVKSELATIKAEKEAAEAAELFNSRMAALDEIFDLTDEDRAILVPEVKALDSDDAFAKWTDNKKKLLKEKTKEFKKAQASKLQEAVEKAAGKKVSIDEVTFDIKEVVASVIEEPIQVTPPNTSSVTTDIKSAWAKAFGEGMTINGQTADQFLKVKTEKK